MTFIYIYLVGVVVTFFMLATINRVKKEMIYKIEGNHTKLLILGSWVTVASLLLSV